MSDRRYSISDIRREAAPDLWSEIERRSSYPPQKPPDARSRPLVVVVALLIPLLVIGAVVYALRGLGHGSARPAADDGGVVRYTVDGAPQPLAVGLGAAWSSVSPMSDRGTGTPTLWRIDEATGETTEVEGTTGVEWVAVGDDSVWAICGSATCGGRGVLRISPDGSVTATIPLDTTALQITAAPGVVWVTVEGGLVAIDPATNEVAASFRGSYNLVGVGGGLVWTTTEGRGSTGAVGLDPATGETVASVPFADPCTMEITARIGFVASCDSGMHAGQSDDELIAFNTENGRLLYRVPSVAGQMRLVGDTLWIADRSGDEGNIVLTPYDAATGSPSAASFSVPSGPARFDYMSMFGPHVFFAMDDDSLWVTDFSAGAVVRVPVATALGSPASPTKTDLVFLTDPNAQRDAMEALLQGPLVVRDGCVLVGVQGNYTLPIWPKDFTAETGDSGVVVRDAAGQVVAIEGQTLEMGGGYIAEFEPADKVEPRAKQVERVSASLDASIPGRCVDDPEIYGIWLAGGVEPIASTATREPVISPIRDGVFDWCPAPPFREAGPTWREDAAAVAETFVAAYSGQNKVVLQSQVDRSVPDGASFPVTGPARAVAFNAAGGALVRAACGADVDAYTVSVAMDDGTSSASMDFTVYLVLRDDGWKVWAVY